MKKQRNYFKSKEQEKSPEKNNETDLNSLSDPGFKKQAIKMLKNLRKVIDKNVAHCNNELKTIKKQTKRQDKGAHFSISIQLYTDVLAREIRREKF